MRRVLALAFVAAFALGTHADAWLIQKPATAGYTGPGDIATFTAWWGTRAYSAAKAASGTTIAINIKRVNDNQTCDVLIATTGTLGLTTNCSGASNGVSVNTFCNGTTCVPQKLYDQVAGNACGGASCDLLIGASNSQLVSGGAACFSNSARYCIGLAASSQGLTSANNFTPTAALVSLSVVGKRASSLSSLSFMANVGNGNTLQSTSGSSGNWTLRGGAAGTFNASAAEAVWHTGNAVINGASSVLAIDGVDTTGSATASTTAAKPGTVSGAGTLGNYTELGMIDNVALSAGQRASLDANQRAFWGF